ncbi:MAG: polysaccharide biosynthesis transport protein [Abditibacteriota bacterium]|nr:polysaccharide biosynthesis transport protein [Abditibacteriota bacterium]
MSDLLPSATPFDAASNQSGAITRRTLDLSRTGENGTLPAPREDDQSWDGGAFRQLLAMLKRRRKVVLSTLACVLAATLFFLIFSPAVYQSVATLQVHTAPIASSDSQSRDLPVVADLSGATQSRSLETQLAILRSNAIRQGAIARLSPGAKVEAEKYFEADIEAVGDTDLISLTTLSHNPYASAAISNSFCKEYINLSRNKNRGQIQEASNYVGRQLRTAQAELSQARNALSSYKQRNGTFDLTSESQNLLTEVGQIESEWRQARADKAGQLAELNKLRSVASGIPATRIVPEQIVRRPAVEAMKTQLTRLELERLAALEEYKPTRPEVQVLEGQIAAIRERLRSEAQTEVGSWTNEVNPVRQTLVQDIAKLQGQVWATEARGVAMKAASKRARAQLALLPDRERRLGQLTTDLTAKQQAYQMLNEKYQTLRMTQEARVANASILFPADPGIRVSASKGRSLAIALVLGLMLAIGLAALLDWMDDRVHSVQDAKLVSRLPILAQIPFIQNEGAQSLMQSTFATTSPSPSGAVASPGTSLQAMPDNPALLETFHMVRTTLALAARQRPISSVTITSSLPNEGKSVTSVNLAIAAALGGERVIIVDCDLRRPALHRLFGLPNEVGISDVIQGTHSLSQALQMTKVPNLRVLTSGPLVPNPFQLLNSPAAQTCLQQVMEQADFVVVDSPPALILADAQILSTMTDATLLVISSQEAGRSDIVRTRDLLSATGNKPVGVILNKIAPTTDDSYHYEQYGYFTGSNSGRSNLARRFSL